MGSINVSVIMHKGMGGPHLFHIFVKSSDPENPVTVIKVKADIVSLETWRHSHPNAFYLPRDVAEFKLVSESVGIEIVPKSLKALGHLEQLKYAYLGKYKNYKKQTHLLAAEYADAASAKNTLWNIIGSLKRSAGASDQLIKREVAGTSVYSFRKDAKERFYFQSVDKVFFLFPDSSVAMRSLEDVLKHIQTL